MRVDRIVSKQGNRRYTCILLRHAYRDAQGKCKHRTLANLTHCSPEEIAAIELALKHKEDLSVLSSLKEIKTVEGLSVGAVCLLYTLMKELLDQAEVELPPFLPIRKRGVYTRKNLTVRRK